MKNDIGLFIAGSIMMLTPSCLGGGDVNNLTEVKDAQISSLVLSHDSITGLSNVKFTIDQVNGFIFNNDSLPYGTKINKVTCALTYVTGVNGVGVVQDAIGGDSTIWWNGTDSLDFSQPVRFTPTAYDGVTTKTYKAWVNIHQIIPGLMVWERFAAPVTGISADERKVVSYTLVTGDREKVYLMYSRVGKDSYLHYSAVNDAKNWSALPLTGLPETADLTQITPYEDTLYVHSDGSLYQSADGSNWTKVEQTPTVGAILGVLKEGRNKPSALAVIVESGSSRLFAGMNRDKQWTEGSAVPDNFPQSGFGSLSYYRVSSEYLTLVGGKDNEGRLLNTTWTTGDALSWALLSGEQDSFFEKKAGAMLTLYDDKLYLMGGINAEGRASKDIHVSIDSGVTWSVADSLKAFPDEYAARGYASVEVDDNKYMLIFGGKTTNGTKTLDELWRGRINLLK
ncbi:MAG: DUF5018 domain-containing protein [Tannerellaceae bacterium]|nr:DUF5018 domain-containing protein [Tannerellaceae bacterium]